jgi:hypothetical protein
MERDRRRNPTAECAIFSSNLEMASERFLQVRHPPSKSQDATCNLLDSWHDDRHPGRMRKLLQGVELRQGGTM